MIDIPVCPHCGGEGCKDCERPLVRSGDLDTSHAAARATAKKLSQTKIKVLLMYGQVYPKELNDGDLNERCCAEFGHRKESSYRKRRGELVRDGYIEDTGRREMWRGSMRAVWRLKK